MDIPVGESYFIAFNFRYSRDLFIQKAQNRSASSLHGRGLFVSVRVTNSSHSQNSISLFKC